MTARFRAEEQADLEFFFVNSKINCNFAVLFWVRIIPLKQRNNKTCTERRKHLTARKTERLAQLNVLFLSIQKFFVILQTSFGLGTPLFFEYEARLVERLFFSLLRGKETEKVQQLSCGIRRMGPAKAGYPLFK